ncbi:MAG: hypothetical protein JSS66_01090 [Armatimonadetes bacterium]|nr:hypothetical protein [Armatimonadota bacterium]
MIEVSVEGRLGGRANMSRDEALFERAEKGTACARIYGWDGPWVSLGRFQSPERALAAECTVPWVVRPTGGKAVLHGHDVTLGLAVPLEDLGVRDSRSLGPVYRAVVSRIVQAMQECGVPAALGEDTSFVASRGHTSDCFAHVAPNDVVDKRTGQKVCGCALRLGSKAVLVQASIPAARPLVDPAMVFRRPAPAAWVDMEPGMFAEALRQGFLDRPSRLPDSVQ